jgi:DNA-binding MarR family transcriptional regulator
MPRLGEALKAMVGEGEDALDAKGRPESVLMNPTRQRIFEHLCHYPASRLRQIARRLGMNATVVQFHLRKMIGHQYLAVKDIDGSNVYFPSDLRLSGEDMAALAGLADDAGRGALRRIVEKPGLTPAELALEIGRSVAATRKLMLSMESQGLVAVIMDGRHTRLFPGEALPILERRTRRLLRGMKSRLMNRLARDRLSPEVELDARRENIIILKIGGKRYRLTIPSESLMPWAISR